MTKVFISHSSKDKPFVRRLKDELIVRGIEVWLDEVEIRVGHSIPEEINRGIAECDILCFVISKDSVNSDWVTRELNSFLPRVINHVGIILPCKTDSARPPALLADLKYADFSTSFETGLEDLLNGIGFGGAVTNPLTRDLSKSSRNKAELERLSTELLGTLTAGETLFFVHRFQKSRYYMIGDVNDIPAHWGALNKLHGLGLLDRSADKREVLFYQTDKGEDALAVMSRFVPEDVLFELDKTEGPRRR